MLATTILRRSRGEATIGAAASSLVNAGNLGLPLSSYVFGSTTEVSALILFQYVVLVPICLAILDSEGSERRTIGKRLTALIKNPIIAASAMGMTLAIADVSLPAPLHDPLDILAALAIPTVLIAFGISLSASADRPSRANRGDLALALTCKAVLMPLAAYALARWGFRADDHQVTLVTVLAALPAAQNINTYASVYRRGEGLARDATLVSTALSVPLIVVVVALTV